MLAIEEVLRELSGEDMNEQGLPPGFRFHPTDEELVTFYLASKVFNGSFSGVDIAEVDLNRCEPWELPDVAKMGEREWYFFSLRDRKYPTGLRTNRATGAGYWKATGKDREVFNSNQHILIGMKKTLVFYKGSAPRGEKTKWVMHEYRLDGHFSCRHTSKEEWVICRIYHKSGDKKNPLFQGRQGYHLLEGCLPKLLETTTTTTSATSCDNITTTSSSILSSPTASKTATTSLLDQQYQTHNSMQLQALLQLQVQSPNYLANHQENDIKALINKYSNNSQSSHHLFPINGFQTNLVQPTSFSPPRDTTTSIKTPTNNNNPYPYPYPSATLFKSLLSHQDYYNCNGWKEQEQEQLQTTTTVPKQCKTESSFSHFQLPQHPNHETESDHHNQAVPYDDDHYQNPNMIFEQIDHDYGNIVLGLSSVNDVGAVHDLSTSAANFNRNVFHSNISPNSLHNLVGLSMLD